MLSQTPGSFQSSTALLEPGFVRRPDSTSMPMNPITSAAAVSWSNNSPAVGLSNQTKGISIHLFSNVNASLQK